jgi:hypothetical protein
MAGGRDASRPISTGCGTRRVHLVRGEATSPSSGGCGSASDGASGASSSSESGGTSRDAATSAASARGACRRAARTAASPPRRRGVQLTFVKSILRGGAGQRGAAARGATRGARGAGAADLARRDHGLDDEPHPLLHCGVVGTTPREPAAQLRAARRAHRAPTSLRARGAGCAGRAACAYLTSGSLGGEALVQRREHLVVAQRVRDRLPAARGHLPPRPARLSAPSGAAGGRRGGAAAGGAARVVSRSEESHFPLC